MEPLSILTDHWFTLKKNPRGGAGGTTKLEIKQIKENKNIIWLND